MRHSFETMEDTQSLNYNSIDSEFSFESSFESYNKETQAREDEINNKIESRKTTFPNMTSTWMDDYILFGNTELECVNLEISNEGLPSKSGSDDLLSELEDHDMSCVNDWLEDPFARPLEHCPALPHSQASNVNNGQVTAGASNFGLTKSLDLALEEGACTQKRKVTETLANNKSFVEKFREIDEGVFNRLEDKSSTETTDFEVKRRRHSETDPKHENKKLSYKSNVPEFNTKNLESPISTKTKRTSLCGVGRRRRSRSDAKSRNRRSAQTSKIGENSTPSPAAEVPSLSPVNPNEYFDDDELIALDTKELNIRVKYLPKKIVNEIKHRRRTLKNRGYARSCREKKIDETTSLQENNSILEKELAGTGFELQLAKMHRDEWRRKYETLLSEIKRRGIEVEA